MPDNTHWRTPDQYEATLAETAALRLKGWDQRRIAEKLGLSQQQVSIDLRQLYERWREDSKADIDSLMAIELQKLDRLEAEYWDAWERSKHPRQRDRKQTMKLPDGKESKLAEILTEESIGNPSFLAGVERVMKRRADLLGLDAPKKYLIGQVIADLARDHGYSDDEAQQAVIFVEQYMAVHHRGLIA